MITMREWRRFHVYYEKGRLFAKGIISGLPEEGIEVIELAAYETRDYAAKEFCRLYNEALTEIVKLKERLGEEPGDY